jgi:hypothetical protein
MNVSVNPFPSFDDIRKLLHFWFDQQDKWFYFEIELIQIGTEGEKEINRPIVYGNPKYLDIHLPKTQKNAQIIHYVQDRIVGRIHDILPYPPSLLLYDVSIFTISLAYRDSILTTNIISKEERESYGLVFSRISYYEPIKKVEAFLKEDVRIVA